MKIRTKIILIIAGLIVCVISIIVLSLYEIKETSSVYSTIIDGHKLIISFERSLGLIMQFATAPDFIEAKNRWIESIDDYADSLSVFTESPNLRRLLSDKEFKFKYDSLLRASDSALSKFSVIKDQLNVMESEGTLERTDLSDPGLLKKNRDLYYTYYEIKELRGFFSLTVRNTINSLVDSLQKKSGLMQRQRRSVSFMLIFLLCGVSIIFSLIILDGIAKNIIMVSRFMANISKGNFKEKIQIESRDEFGKLSRDSNRFVNDLKENIEKIIQFTKSISRQIIKETDFSSTCENIIQQMLEHVNADGVALYLLNEKKDGLVIKNIIGTYYSPDLIESYDINEINQADSKALFLNKEIPVHNSISGTVVQTNDIVVLSDTETNELPGRLSRKIREPGFSIILAPLTALEQSQGVLSVIRLGRNSAFTDLDLIHIKSFTDYVGLAIDSYHKLKIQAEKNRLEQEIAERIKTQQEREALIEKLEEKNRELKDTQVQLVHSEKMAGIGQLAAGIAHEINNPTGFIIGNLQVLGQYMENVFKRVDRLESELKSTVENGIDMNFIKQDTPKLIRDTLEGAERIKNIVADLKDFTHPAKDIVKQSDINGEIEKALSIIDNELKHKCTVGKDFDELPPVFCNPQELQQVLINICINAIQAMEIFGKIDIRTRKGNNEVIIEIEDNGKGIEQEHLNRIFDPFYTTKDVGKGTGLGLSVSYGIIQEHNGSIGVKSIVGKGTVFTITLPLKGNNHE